jgi:coenzyme F420-reducing hydrogenase beta subunit
MELDNMKISPMQNTVKKIVNNDFCIGCGICAGICPAGALKMIFNKYGEYNVQKEDSLCSSCGLCLKVCPFYYKNENEYDIAKRLFYDLRGIQYQPEIGFYLNTYVCYSKAASHRAQGASGGMVTWLLETLLRRKTVDFVVCVTSTDNQDKLFQYSIFDDYIRVRAASGSAYYPVELSEVLKNIMNKEGRYAIVGLPCFLKGLHLAMADNETLKKRIILTVGLVCGQLKNKSYTSYLAGLAGVKGKLKKVQYRGKDPSMPSNNYFFTCKGCDGTTGKLYYDSGVSEAFINKWFTPNACNYCGDVYSEVADVTFMDAWLPEYTIDSNGTNLAITRSALAENIMGHGMKSKEIDARQIEVDRIIDSQRSVINTKKKQLSYRLFLDKRKAADYFSIRVKTDNEISLLNKREVVLRDAMQQRSKEAFLLCYSSAMLDVHKFRSIMLPFLKKLKRWQIVCGILSNITFKEP